MSAPSSSSARSVDLRFVAVLVAAGGLLIWFLSGLHWSEVARVLREASWGWVALAALLLFVEYPIRAWRWTFLVVDVDPDVRMRDVLSATQIGAAFNTFLPLRGGDLVRIAVLARRRRMSFTTALSTTLVERLLDALGLVGAIVFLLWMLPDTVGGKPMLGDYRQEAAAAGAGAMVLLSLGVLAGSHGADRVVERVARLLPTPVGRRVVVEFRALAAGLAAMSNPIRLIPAAFATVLVWLAGWAALVCAFKGFHLEIPAIAGFFVNTAIIMAVAVPQAPGFVGLFQVVLAQTLGLWGADVGVTEAMALVMWGLYFGPITIVGTIDALREGHGLLSFREHLFEDFGGKEAVKAAEEDLAARAAREALEE